MTREEPWGMPPDVAHAWAMVFRNLAEKEIAGELLIDTDTIPPRELARPNQEEPIR